jgi:ribosome-associated heat shock protein Hsp15
LKGRGASAEVTGRRLDQWLWFARFVKSRSLAARLCVTGAVTVNGVAARKPNHMLRIGDILAAPQGAFCRTVRVLSLGTRRGPASEARKLYEEFAAPVHLSNLMPAWTPRLMGDDEESEQSGMSPNRPELV